MTPGFLQTCWAHWLVGTLAQAGVREWITSPGSRSTPFVAAALSEPGLVLRSVLDERSAGYFALGRARATGTTIALLCTSGTAAANYLPAIVDANLCHAPLLVLTADRPAELLDCAAPQTVDQVNLYGVHVRRFVDLDVPAPEEASFLAVRRRILSVLQAGRYPVPGPIHFNLRARKPLEPVAPETPAERDFAQRLQVLAELPQVVSTPTLPPVSPSCVEDFISILDEPRGLVVCGFDCESPPLDPACLAAFARATGYPILLDAAHPLRLDASPELVPYVVAPHDPLLRIPAWRHAQVPRLVVQIGRPLTSSAWQEWLEEKPAPRLILLTRHHWSDPTGRADWVAFGDPNQLLQRAAQRLLDSTSPRSSGWQARWFRAGLEAKALTDQLPSIVRASYSELEAVRTVLRSLPRGTHLLLGNSLPVREVDLLAAQPGSGVKVVGLRGASGIDGITSFAAAWAQQEDSPTLLLTGDLSFLHDLGGLWAASDVSSPLCIVVLNNSGGRIFEQLPVASSVAPDQLTFWTKPQSFHLSAASQLYGLDGQTATNNSELETAIAEALSRPTATVVEVRVLAGSARQDSLAFVAAVDRALSRAGLAAEQHTL